LERAGSVLVWRRVYAQGTPEAIQEFEHQENERLQGRVDQLKEAMRVCRDEPNSDGIGDDDLARLLEASDG
jgi:hypothetical protein